MIKSFRELLKKTRGIKSSELENFHQDLKFLDIHSAVSKNPDPLKKIIKFLESAQQLVPVYKWKIAISIIILVLQYFDKEN